MLKIQKRALLVLAVEVAQLVCLLAALMWFGQWLDDALSSVLAQTATGSVSNLGSGPIDVGHSIHRIVGAVKNVGFAVGCVLFVFSASLTALILRRYETRLDSANAQLATLVDRRSHALMKTRDAVIFGLARLAESRDDQTGEHLDRIGLYVEILAKALRPVRRDLDDNTVKMMAMASSLHDIGKVGIPDSILMKPGRLTPDERIVIERHPLIGGECLLAIKQRLGEDDFLTTACEIAFCHHERWDGTGYPYGLHGADIPITGRIVALADVYDALTSRRVYKDAMPHELARDIIVQASGTQFDPQIVAAFKKCHHEFAEIAARSTQTLRLAKVA